MAILTFLRRRLLPRLPLLAYGASVVLFLVVIGGRYLPGQGFTPLLLLGDRVAAQALPQLQHLQPYTYPDSSGYDGQYYAQLAMQPDLTDPALNRAIDNLPFRARRILVSWLCWGLAGGDPDRALHLYSVCNILCWLALAVLLTRWFPPVDWQNYLRWAGILFSFGLCYSVHASLLDGPSLLALAGVAALWGRGRPWWAAAVLGLAGLIRETNLLAAVLLLPFGSRDWRVWRAVVLQGVVAAAPLALWCACLVRIWGWDSQFGAGNYNWPLLGLARRWHGALAAIFAAESVPYNTRNLLTLLALTVQAGFIILWARPRDHWWRLGAAMVALMALLGGAVWEGYPVSAARVLLPLGLAFNILVPRHWKWLPVLLAGNITVLTAMPVLGNARRTERSYVFDQKAPAGDPAVAGIWSIRFDDSWYGAECSRWQYWRWSRSDARLVIVNPLPHAVRARARFGLKSRDHREIVLTQNGRQLWSGASGAELRQVELPPLVFPPGETEWTFTVTPTAPYVGPRGGNAVAFSLRDLVIELHGPANEPPAAP